MFLVDGPSSLNGPFATFLKREYPSTWLTRFDKKSCVKDTDCHHTKWSHCCCKNSSKTHPPLSPPSSTFIQATDACDSKSRGSPESQGTCGKTVTYDSEVGALGRYCERLTTRSHVFDVGAKSWLLPAVIAEARRGPTPQVSNHLEALLEIMTARNQEDRPSFGELLRMIEAL